jgi:hypothetical protein
MSHLAAEAVREYDRRVGERGNDRYPGSMESTESHTAGCPHFPLSLQTPSGVFRLRCCYFSLLISARVVSGIDVVKLQRCHSVDLYHDLAGSHCIVVHIGIEESKTAGGEGCHLGRLKNISHSNFERSGDDRDVFPQGMLVGRDPVSVRHLHTHGIFTAGGARVALEYSELCAGGYKWWRRTPWNGVRGKYVAFVRLVRSDLRGKGKTSPAQQSSQCEGQVHASFHVSSPFWVLICENHLLLGAKVCNCQDARDQGRCRAVLTVSSDPAH